jgi:hypothetical protein
MWPFLLIPITIAAFVAFRRSEAGRERRRGLTIVTVLAAVIAILGVMPLMGIPGAVVYELSAPWVRAIQGAGFRELGDGAWPAALVITLTWPWSLVLAYVQANGPLRRRGRVLRWTTMAVLPYLVGILLALWAHLSAAS